MSDGGTTRLSYAYILNFIFRPTIIFTCLLSVYVYLSVIRFLRRWSPTGPEGEADARPPSGCRFTKTNHISQYMQEVLHWFPFPERIVSLVCLSDRAPSYLGELYRSLSSCAALYCGLLATEIWCSHSPALRHCTPVPRL